MKITIVTPSYNSEEFIEETLHCVLSQKGEFFLEYIVVDGSSTDGTVGIIKKYDEMLREGKWPIRCRGIDFKWVSEPDKGMYAAINKGFSMGTGDIYAWINSDDTYLPNVLNLACRVFSQFPQINWFSGAAVIINESSTIDYCPPYFLYNRELLKKGFYNPDNYVLSQEGTFWKSGLWKKAGGIDEGLKLAGDFYLWTRFAEFEKLYTINTFLSCFREHASQLSSNMAAYKLECERFVTIDSETKKLKAFFKLWRKIPPLFRLYKYIFNHEYNLIIIEKNILSLKKYRYFLYIRN